MADRDSSGDTVPDDATLSELDVDAPAGAVKAALTDAVEEDATDTVAKTDAVAVAPLPLTVGAAPEGDTDMELEGHEDDDTAVDAESPREGVAELDASALGDAPLESDVVTEGVSATTVPEAVLDALRVAHPDAVCDGEPVPDADARLLEVTDEEGESPRDLDDEPDVELDRDGDGVALAHRDVLGEPLALREGAGERDGDDTALTLRAARCDGVSDALPCSVTVPAPVALRRMVVLTVVVLDCDGAALVEGAAGNDAPARDDADSAADAVQAALAELLRVGESDALGEREVDGDLESHALREGAPETDAAAENEGVADDDVVTDGDNEARAEAEALGDAEALPEGASLREGCADWVVDGDELALPEGREEGLVVATADPLPDACGERVEVRVPHPEGEALCACDNVGGAVGERLPRIVAVALMDAVPDAALLPEAAAVRVAKRGVDDSDPPIRDAVAPPDTDAHDDAEPPRCETVGDTELLPLGDAAPEEVRDDDEHPLAVPPAWVAVRDARIVVVSDARDAKPEALGDPVRVPDSDAVAKVLAKDDALGESVADALALSRALSDGDSEALGESDARALPDGESVELGDRDACGLRDGDAVKLGERVGDIDTVTDREARGERDTVDATDTEAVSRAGLLGNGDAVGDADNPPTWGVEAAASSSSNMPTRGRGESMAAGPVTAPD